MQFLEMEYSAVILEKFVNYQPYEVSVVNIRMKVIRYFWYSQAFKTCIVQLRL